METYRNHVGKMFTQGFNRSKSSAIKYTGYSKLFYLRDMNVDWRTYFRRKIKFFGIFSKFVACVLSTFSKAFLCPILRSLLIKMLTLWAKWSLNGKLQIPETKEKNAHWTVFLGKMAASSIRLIPVIDLFPQSGSAFG